MTTRFRTLNLVCLAVLGLSAGVPAAPLSEFYPHGINDNGQIIAKANGILLTPN